MMQKKAMLCYEQYAAFSNDSKRDDEPFELDEDTCGPLSEKADLPADIDSQQLNNENPSFALLGHLRQQASSPAPSDIYSETQQNKDLTVSKLDSMINASPKIPPGHRARNTLSMTTHKPTINHQVSCLSPGNKTRNGLVAKGGTDVYTNFIHSFVAKQPGSPMRPR